MIADLLLNGRTDDGNTQPPRISPSRQLIVRYPIIFSQVVPVTAVTYADGQSLGGKLTFTSIMQEHLGRGYWESLSITDKDLLNQPMTLALFSSDPSTSTLTNGVAVSIAAADAFKRIGTVHIGADQWYLGQATVRIGGLLVRTVVNRNLYGVLIARGPATRTANALNIDIGTDQI